VVATMSDINASSGKIADIVSVIDGIAFQTNILALNAAVEAARAGESGRGFAVVAGEVRALAQRSATAAKEIRQLTSESVSKISSGNTVVSSAREAIDKAVGAVRNLATIVGEISSASAEQRDGISQVGHAVTQLEQNTQQNAALVEEATAAAGSLEQQARALTAAVAGFRLA
jgi:methyl-accepting chemotaxis protein